MRSRSLCLALVLVVAAAVGWWWKSAQVVTDVATPSITSTPASKTAESQRLDVSAPPEGSADESRTEAAPTADVAATPTSATTSTPLGGDEAWIEITAVAKEDGRALPSVRVYARALTSTTWSAKNVDAVEGGELESPRTGDDGLARIRVRAGLVYGVGAYLQAPPESRATCNVTALGAGETRAVRMELPTTADVPFFARVVAEDDRSPIAGATVTQLRGTGELREGRLDKLLSGAPVVQSGADGEFELRGESWANTGLRVEAPGFGRRLAALRTGHETRARALSIELSRAARLNVVVLGTVAEPLTVTATTPAHAIAQRESEGDYFGGGTQQWRAPVGADGRATLAELPPNAHLRIVLGAGDRVLVQPPEPVTLEPGEERTLELEVGLGATVVGSLRDDAGLPIVDAEVWLLPREDSWNGFKRWHQPLRQAATDAQGSFELADVGVGTWAVGLAPAENGVDPSEALAGLPVEVVVAPSDRRVAVELRVSRGLSIAGRVVDRAGNPIAGVYVGGWGPGDLPTVRTNEDGSFEIAPLIAGEWTLSAGGFGAWAECDPLTVQAGDQDVVLVLDRGAALSITAVDESDAPVRRGTLTWSPANVGVDGSGITHTGIDGGDRMVMGLRSGTFDFVVTTGEREIGVERVVVAVTTDPTPVKIRVRPGGSLIVRTSKNDTWIPFTVRCDALRVSQGTASKDGVETLVVPADTLRIEWLSPTTNTVRSREVHVDVGQKIEIELEDG